MTMYTGVYFFPGHSVYIPRESKKQDTLLLPTTSPNVDRFSKFFHRWTQ